MGKKLTEEEVISRFRDVHGDKYDYSKVVYVDMNSKVTIICPEHGEFEQTPAKHINRKHKGRQYFIEYDGEQHFSPTYRFYDSMADFQMQQYRDQLLNDFCDRHKDAVTLIRVNCRQCEAEITHTLSSTIA